MDVVSTGPLRVASMVWQPRPGTWALTVVCKVAFRLQPGVAPLAEEQSMPLEDDAHWDGVEAASLRAPSDLVPFKARTDVLLVGFFFPLRPRALSFIGSTSRPSRKARARDMAAA